MQKILQLCAYLIFASILLSPIATFAQANASSSQSASTQSSGNGIGTAIGVGVGVAAGALIFNALASSASKATGIPFGGRVATIIPCLVGVVPALHVTIVPARASAALGVTPKLEPYIYTAGTITYLAGPPTHPGQEILGKADIPFACFIPVPGFFFTTFIPLYGLRMQQVGTSVI
ncbi:MAG: hypothetical protein V4436_00505 [Patescibacteria group bacterium]